MVTTRSQDAPTSSQPKTTSLSINEPTKPSQHTTTSRRPPNKRALSSNHIGAPPDLFPTLSAHASKIHKAKSHILLFFLICIFSGGVYLLNPHFLGSIIKSLAASSWTTIAVAVVTIVSTGLGVVYWTDVYKVDFYELVVEYWWVLIPAFGSVGWVVVMAQHGDQDLLDVD